ncbi:oxidoreductase [Arthrobacter sp. zg-Y916]|uniref:FAD-dependent oxidoreductase n=1 Tax=Arthrobacter sp. zg-Y916 TaxID=2894190 RepID=UPI001E5F1580|nr:oxidoreductase [Arthrobacter sp. zg-Y916]MCC9192939.1 oxidoreductase [Arthrobacter sp. zg-Y916]
MTVSLSPPTARLQRLLGKMSMYRMLVVLLLALAAWSFVLSLTGALHYTPAELAATLATSVVSTLVASRVMGLLFRTFPMTDSALITGLLLFFLFWPTTDGPELGTIALAAFAATASKYVLVWRRRHIFNPAALGAVVIGFTGLNVPVWWVAAPLMLVVVLPAALLVLYRSRLLPMAGVFVLVAAGIVGMRFAVSGEPVLDGLATAFMSYPILFFAGFMLSEPLTLPPLRWQRLAEAAVVGVLFATPLSVGPVFMSPELALLIGNLLAFAVGQRGGISLRLREARELTPTSRELIFEPARPLRFRAGQYLELSLPHPNPDGRGLRRVFSITSDPADGSTVSLGLRVSEPGSSFKTKLLALKPGARLSATSVGGDFQLPRDPSRKLLLVASGIGITPFISQLRSAEAEGRDAVLVYAASSAAELAYAGELAEMDVRVLACTPEDPGVPGWKWLGPGLPDGARLREAVPDAAERTAFLAGSPSAVAYARREIRSAGVRRMHTDPFLGY